MATYVQTGYRHLPDGIIASMALAGSANLTSATWTRLPFHDVTQADYDVQRLPWQVLFYAETPQARIDATSAVDRSAEELVITSAGTAGNGNRGLDEVWANMEAAAEAADERSFIAAFERIDWELQPPDAVMRAVRLAITADAPLVARKLATEGAHRHPEHAELQKAARILAPPRVIRSDLPPNPGMAHNVRWLKEQGASYRGSWVALREGQLLATADSLQALIERVGKHRDILYTVA